MRELFPVFFKELEATKTDLKKTEEIAGRLARGKILLTKILSEDKTVEATKETALDVTWFLMACGYDANKQVFHRGVVRLDLNKEQSTRLKTFYAGCREAEAHPRISSHFPKMTEGSQIGLDFAKGDLPFDKELSTLLCGSLKDGTFFIKLEREPFSFYRPLSSIKHAWNWFSSSAFSQKEEVGGKKARRETGGIQKASSHYFQVVNTLAEIDPNFNPKAVKTAKSIHEMYQVVKTAEEKLAQIEEQTSSAIDDPALFVKESGEEEDSIGALTPIPSWEEESLSSLSDSGRSTPNQYESRSPKQLARNIESFKKSISHIQDPEKAVGEEVIVRLDSFLSH
jgi:hypothetical protein